MREIVIVYFVSSCVGVYSTSAPTAYPTTTPCSGLTTLWTCLSNPYCGYPFEQNAYPNATVDCTDCTSYSFTACQQSAGCYLSAADNSCHPVPVGFRGCDRYSIDETACLTNEDTKQCWYSSGYGCFDCYILGIDDCEPSTTHDCLWNAADQICYGTRGFPSSPPTFAPTTPPTVQPSIHPYDIVPL